MVNNAAYSEIATIVRPEHFHDGAHGEIFRCMGHLIGDGKTADPVSICASIDNAAGALIEDYLAGMAKAAASIVDAPTYATLVRDDCHRRQLMGLGREMRDDLMRPDYQDTPEAIFAKFVGEGQAVLADCANDTMADLGKVLGRLGHHLGKRIEPIQTGLPSMDRSIGGGLRAEDLYVIEAPAKTFKTGTMGTIALQLIRDDVPFLFVSLEMAPEQILARLVSAETGTNAQDLMDTRYHESSLGRISVFSDRYGQRKCYFADRPGIDQAGLAALCAQAVVKFGVAVVFIDYWQLIGGKGRNESMADHLESVAYWAAAFARKNGVAVVMASQLNRQGESLRSAGIERACSWLARLHRCEQNDISGPIQGLWMDVPYSRFAEDCNIGSEDNPAFRIDGVGPVLREIGDWRRA